MTHQQNSPHSIHTLNITNTVIFSHIHLSVYAHLNVHTLLSARSHFPSLRLRLALLILSPSALQKGDPFLCLCCP